METLAIPYHAARIIPATAVLVLAPHPDDEIFGCAGAIMRHVEQGVPVRVIIVTDGAFDTVGEQRAAHTALRQVESRAAAAMLGYGEPEFWELPDRGLVYGEPLIQRIEAAVGDRDLVYAPSIAEIHPDHRALGMAALEATRRLGGRLRLAMYEVGMPLHPNLLLDISDLIARKQQAMECFPSQLAVQDYDQHVAGLNRFRTYTLPRDVTGAEAFRVCSAQDLRADPLKIYQPEYLRQRELGLRVDCHDAPLVSVIVKNSHPARMGLLLDAIALQTHPHIEVLVETSVGVTPAAWCGRFPMRASNQPGLDARGEYLLRLEQVISPDFIAANLESGALTKRSARVNWFWRLVRSCNDWRSRRSSRTG